MEKPGWLAIESLHTFTSWNRVVPHHIPIFQDAGDGLRSVSFEEALFTQEGHRASQLQTVSEPLPVYRNARIRTLVVAECWTEKLNLHFYSSCHHIDLIIVLHSKIQYN